MDDFYVCPDHARAGGYESCCACGGWDDGPDHGRLCSEATDKRERGDVSDHPDDQPVVLDVHDEESARAAGRVIGEAIRAGMFDDDEDLADEDVDEAP